MSTRELTQAELIAEATERFGGDVMNWAFQCPACGDIATCREFFDAAARAGAVGQECMGRHVLDRGCNFAAYGLIPAPWLVTLPSGKVVRSFPLAPAPVLAALAIGNSEPIPDGLPAEVIEIVRGGRTEAGWCDHGKRFGACCEDPR